ncbi:MAG: hypothetical protein M1830_004385 [Pleopsidium flavum]|nr:MAG: hypothetical protein M1830_004385 [Pleopsidium flavum]
MRSITSFGIAVATVGVHLTGTAQAFWRLPCQALSGLARIDPIVNPGVPSDHAHAVFGSGVTQDKSAYWTPALYFVDGNGKAELVENVGGMLA